MNKKWQKFFCFLLVLFCLKQLPVTAAPLASADLSVTISDSPDPVLAGGNISYSIVLRNNGPDGAQNLALAASVPANTTFQSISPAAGWTCITPAVGGTGSINCTAASVASGTNLTFPLTVKVNAGTPNGTSISNSVSLTSTTPDPGSTNNSAATTTAVAAPDAADIELSLTGVPATAGRGSNISYPYTFRNNGPASATNLQANFNVPANTTFQSMSVPAGWTCITPSAGGTGSVQCTRSSALTSGASNSFTLVVKINTGAAGGTVISEMGTSAGVSASADPNGANNTAGASTTVLVPSAATVTVAGRVTTVAGRGIAGVRVEAVDSSGHSRVVLTNQFGFYRFVNLTAGEVYIFEASHKNYTFESRVLNLSNTVDDLDFTAAVR